MFRSYTVLDPPLISSSSSSSSSLGSSSSLSSTTRGAALSTNASSSNSSSSSHVLPIALGTVLGALGLLVVGIAAWLCSRRKKRPKSEAWTNADASLHESIPPLPPQQSTAFQTNYAYGHQQQPQGVCIPYTNGSRSSSKLQMSDVEVPSIAQSLLNPRDTSYNNRPPLDFNPWVDLPYQQQQAPYPQQQIPYGHQVYHPRFYSPRSLSTITEKSTPGTMNSTRLPLPVASSLASRPSAEFSYYSPPSGTSGNGIQLPYASDLPITGAATPNPHQSSPSSVPGPANANASNVLLGKV